MKIQLPVHIDVGATANETKFLGFDERYELKSVKVVDAAGVTADASDYIILKVFGNDQTTEAFEWSTQDSAQGALTAGVDADLVDKKSGKTIFEASDTVKITKTHANSGKAVDAMLILSFEQARKY